MLWVYSNFFFFFKSTKIYNNFFFLNYFNNFTLIFFCKNFSPIIKILDKKINFNVNFNYYKYNNNLMLLKYFKYFNKLIFLKTNKQKLNQLIFYDFNNKFNFFYLSKFNFFYLKNFLNVIISINKENKNFVVLDFSYKNFYPLFNYIFGFKNLLNYKKYFFVKTNYFSIRGWSYYYINFLRKFNIIFLVIFDFNYFLKFFKILKNINLPIASILPINDNNFAVDYPIYLFNYFNLEKLVLLNLISNAVLLSYNFKSYSNRINYLNLFYKFFLKNYNNKVK